MLGTVLVAAGCAGGRGGASSADTANVNAMVHQHAGETPTANASAMEPREPVTGRRWRTEAWAEGRSAATWRSPPRRVRTRRSPAC
jgi:hypothetical protein